MTKSLTQRAAVFILRELIGDVLYFPVWWYSQGLTATWRALAREWLNAVDRLSLRILLKNMGRPMYGDYSRSGRLISFFFRIFLVVVRGVFLILWTAVLVVAMGAWIAGPIVAAAMLVRQAVPL